MPAAISAVRALRPDIALEVEVDTSASSTRHWNAATLILLDNFTLADTERPGPGYPGVKLGRRRFDLARAREVAATGVDFRGWAHAPPRLASPA